jgi:hypothetical protein
MADAIGQFTLTEFNACLWWDLRNGALTNANNSSSLYGWRLYGDYGLVASGDVSGVPADTPYPSYYAAKLLSNWGRGGNRVLSTTSGYSLLSIYAAKLLNGSLALLVINKHPTMDFNAQIALNNFTPGSTTVPVYAYGKSNDLANGDLTTSTASVSGSTINYTFPSYSMSVLLVKGQFEAWREQNFTTTELGNWAYSGDAGQPAQDGVPNLLKYALGLNAKTTATAASLPQSGRILSSGKNYITLSFTDFSTLSDISYSVQASSDLITWLSGSTYTVRLDNGTTSTATYRDLTAFQDAPHHFLRLSITRP